MIAGGMLKGTKIMAKAAGRMLTRAVVGGTVSVITGGKFGNGAVGAAFAQASAEAIHSLDSSANKINELIKSEDPADKIEATKIVAKKNGIDLSDVKTINISSEEGSSIVTGTNINTEQKELISLNLGTDAFASEAMLATTLGHEIEIHWLAQEKSSTGAAIGTRQHIQQEINALKHEISNQRRFGTTNSELSPVRLKIDMLKRHLKIREQQPELKFNY